MDEIKTILDNPLKVESFLNKKRIELSTSLTNILLTELLNEEKKQLFKQKNRAEKFDKGLISQLEFNNVLVEFNYNMYKIKCEKKLIEYNNKKREFFDNRIEEYKKLLSQFKKGNFEVKTINQKMRILIIEEILSMLELEISLLTAKIQRCNYVNQNIDLLNSGNKNQEDEDPMFMDCDRKRDFSNVKLEIEKLTNEKNLLLEDMAFYKDEKKVNSILNRFNITEIPLEYLATQNVTSIFIYLELLHESEKIEAGNIKVNSRRIRN